MATKQELLQQIREEAEKKNNLAREVRVLKRQKKAKNKPEPSVEELQAALTSLKEENTKLEKEKGDIEAELES